MADEATAPAAPGNLLDQYETREGKKLSKQSVGTLKAIMEQLRDFIGGNEAPDGDEDEAGTITTDEPVAKSTPDNDGERSAELAATESALRALAVRTRQAEAEREQAEYLASKAA